MRWIVLPAVVAALVLALAGCGGSNSDASSSDEVTAAEGAGETTSTETTSADESTSTAEMEHGDTTAEGETTPGVDLSGSSLSNECKELVAAASKYSQALSGAAAGGKLDLQSAADALQGVADAAPSEIKDAYETLAAAVGKYADALKGVDLSSGQTPDPATIAKITKAAQSFNNNEIKAATQEISAWTTKNCTSTTP